MERGRIFIANLSKGMLGDDKSSLLGSLLITQFQLAALSREAMPEEKRRDCFLYVDEFQNVATDAFCSILSEARKYRLNLTLSHQFTTQLRPQVREAVFVMSVPLWHSAPVPLSSISKLLHNPFYYGVFRYRDELHEGSHVPMITKECFDNIQKALIAVGKPH